MSSPLSSSEVLTAAGTERAASLSGQVIDGRYRLGLRLGGDGGDPKVELYTATQLSLDRTVLVKVLRLGLGASAAASLTTRLRHEALLLARLDHPNLVRVVDFGVHDGSPYIVRELIEGLSLRRMLASGKVFAPEHAVPILVQLADALEYVHQNGLVHRDLSPTRVILSRDGRVRITDLGLAKLLVRGAEEERSGVMSPNVTSMGSTVEYPEYAAPEVLLGSNVDRRADLYSLGAIAYRMIAKRTPFSGDTAAAVLSARMSQPLVPLAEAAGLPKSALRFAAVVDRLLAVDREQRCSTAAWVGHALRVSVKDVAVPEGDGRETELAEVASERSERASVSMPPAQAVVVETVSASVSPSEPPVVVPEVVSPSFEPARPGPMSVQEARVARDPEMEIAELRASARALFAEPAPEELERTAPPKAPRSGVEWPLLVRPATGHDLPDGTDSAVLVADPNKTEHARAAEYPRAWAGTEDTAVRMDPASERLSDDDPAVRAVKSDVRIALERTLATVGPQAAALWSRTRTIVGEAYATVNERLEPVNARLAERWAALPIAERVQPMSDRLHALRVKLHLPKLGAVQTLAVAASFVLLLLALSISGTDTGNGARATVRAPEPSAADLAKDARAMAKNGEATKAIDALEQALVSGGKYGDPALHAALAAAYVRSGQGARAVQHFGLVIGRDATMLEDEDVASLVGLLGLPKRDGEKVAELVRALGPRAEPALRAVSDDRTADKGLRKKAADLLRGSATPSSPRRASTVKAPATVTASAR